MSPKDEPLGLESYISTIYCTCDVILCNGQEYSIGTASVVIGLGL